METGHGGFGGGLLNEARIEWSDHSSTEKASAGEEADTLEEKEEAKEGTEESQEAQQRKVNRGGKWRGGGS